MNKKLIAILMSGAMAMSFATVSFAEAESEAEVSEATVLNWADFEEQVAANEAWAGDFFEFEEIALKMYVPAAFTAAELTEEDVENGYIAYFELGDTGAVGVQYVDMDGMALTDYAELLTSECGVTDAEYVVINDIAVLSYTNPDDENVGVISLDTEKGYIMEFAFSPITDEGFQAVALVMMASIQEA